MLPAVDRLTVARVALACVGLVLASVFAHRRVKRRAQDGSREGAHVALAALVPLVVGQLAALALSVQSVRGEGPITYYAELEVMARQAASVLPAYLGALVSIVAVTSLARMPAARPWIMRAQLVAVVACALAVLWNMCLPMGAAVAVYVSLGVRALVLVSFGALVIAQVHDAVRRRIPPPPIDGLVLLALLGVLAHAEPFADWTFYAP